MKDSRRDEQLKDRRAYRQALIERREGIDQKIATVEEQIAALKPSKAA
jgi:hypothetical protein